MDKIIFYYFARGSVTETQNQAEYGKRVGYLEVATAEMLDKKLEKIYNELNKLIISLKQTRR